MHTSPVKATLLRLSGQKAADTITKHRRGGATKPHGVVREKSGLGLLDGSPRQHVLAPHPAHSSGYVDARLSSHDRLVGRPEEPFTPASLPPPQAVSGADRLNSGSGRPRTQRRTHEAFGSRHHQNAA